MGTRHILIGTALAALVLGATPPAAYAAPVADLDWSPEPGLAMERETPEMFAALLRDFEIDREEALRRLGQQRTASELEERLKNRLGDRYAGGWVSDDGATLTVAVTDTAAARVARNAGAVPQVVRYPLAVLHAAAERLRATPVLGASVQGWNVDSKANRVNVTATTGQLAAARAFVAAAGVDAALVRYEQRAESSRPKVDVRGGIGFQGRAGGCSIGFNVFSILVPGSVGFLTAGHCNPVGANAREPGDPEGFGQTVISTWGVQGGVPDRAYVEFFPGVTPTPLIATYGAPSVVVQGSLEAPENTPICASGAKTKWRCGKIIRKNRMETLPFEEPPNPFVVFRLIVGLTEAKYRNDCGDSGGPVLAGNQAQGIHVAGNGPECGQVGSMALFQPVNPILFGLSLRLVEPFVPPGIPPLPLLIPIPYCEQRPQSPDIFEPAIVDCRGSWQGGIDPGTPLWTTGGDIPTFDDPYAWSDPATRRTTFSLTCQGTGPVDVSLSIVDASGGLATASTSVFCQLPIPPW